MSGCPLQRQVLHPAWPIYETGSLLSQLTHSKNPSGHNSLHVISLSDTPISSTLPHLTYHLVSVHHHSLLKTVGELSLLTCMNLDIPTSGEKPDQETVSVSSNKPAVQPTIGQLQVV